MKQGFFIILLLVCQNSASYAQSDQGLPLPGAITTHQAKVEYVTDIAPVPGRTVVIDRSASSAGQVPVNTAPAPSSPLPGSSANYQASAANKSSYQLLPISASEAKTRLDELKTLLLISRPQAIQERIYNLCDWLTEMYDAHSKLANAFARLEDTKGSSLIERSTAQRFSQLKNEAQLLKAELLIKQNRSPEALGSLIDIIVADPKSGTAKIAYQHLKELGFSENVPEQTMTQMTKESSKQIELANQIQAKSPKAGQSTKQGHQPTNVQMPGKHPAGPAGRPQPSHNIVKINR